MGKELGLKAYSEKVIEVSVQYNKALNKALD